MGFLSKANNTTTTAGGFDAMLKAREADRLLGLGKGLSIPKSAALKAADSADYGLPGSGIIGKVGGVLSALGAIGDVTDMLSNGISYDNSLSLSGNLAGVGSALLGASPAGVALATYSATTATASAGNDYAKEKGFLGETNSEYEAPGNRGWDDASADAGRWVRDKLGGGTIGQVAGGVTTVASSIPLGVAAVGSGIASGAESAGRWMFDLDNPLLEGIGPQIAAAPAANSNDTKGS